MLYPVMPQATEGIYSQLGFGQSRLARSILQT
jgi:hypothetical protein